ncbi:MAG: alpha/beta hydrolase [Chloroflexi bacterium]|nr:MAG: alpha/beta hydrolase [Chloroflexota bacterium]
MPVTFAGIHYDDTEGGTEAVVLLHGVTLDRRMWEAQVEHLARTHRCLAVDRRGHGLSAPLREGWDPMVDLAEVLDDAEVERCHLVGMSLGGFDAVAAAGRIPERVRSLVLVDAWMPIEAMGSWSAPFALARERGADVARRAWLADPLFAPARELPAVASRIEEIVGANDLSTFTGPPARGPGRAVVEAAARITAPNRALARRHRSRRARAPAGRRPRRRAHAPHGASRRAQRTARRLARHRPPVTTAAWHHVGDARTPPRARRARARPVHQPRGAAALAAEAEAAAHQPAAGAAPRLLRTPGRARLLNDQGGRRSGAGRSHALTR